MSAAEEPSDSAATRRLALRRRADLIICPQRIGRRRWWVVKDPLSLAYFHLRDQEHAVLQMLDGQASLAEIKRRFERAFAPLRVSYEQLHAFLARLHGLGLLLADGPGQGDELWQRRRRHGRLKLLETLTGLLAIRFRGVDPQPWLDWLEPRCRWLFGRWSLLAGVLLALAAVVLVTVQGDVLQSRLPTFEAFFNPHNALWLVLALAAAKLLHELGHALVCKRFGGECHELGVMLLVFTPCLYCDVSDSWMLASKWRRIAIAAAGIYVEVVLAAVCTFLWWFSEPGWVNSMFLNMMFVCSVSTIVFNGNPLLRYDGYFILADLLEVPNLGQQSRQLVAHYGARFCLGMKRASAGALPQTHRGLLVAYAVASTLYRWALVLVILWFCAKILRPYRLQLLAALLAAVVLGGMLMVPLVNVVGVLRNPGFRGRVNIRRGALSIGGLALLGGLVCLVPLPYRVSAPAFVQPEGAQHVYVPVAGRLVWALPVGSCVRPDQPLAKLENLDLQMQVAQLAGQLRRQRLRVENLKYRALEDPGAAAQIPAAEEALADLQQRWQERYRDQQRLVLRAPVAGVVLPSSRVPRPRSDRTTLPTWWGHPLQPHNLGCHICKATDFCIVGDPSRLEALLVVDQSEILFIRQGQRVRLKFDSLPGEILSGTVRRIAQSSLQVLPRELSGQEFPARVQRSGLRQPVETSYHVCVSLDGPCNHLLTGACGRAKVVADSQPLLQRWGRSLQSTFRFQL